MNTSLRDALVQHGVRNSHHNTIAPTGTISLLANNVSNGIEPIFKAEYERHVRGVQKDEVQTFHVADFAYQLWRQQHQDDSLPPAWTDASALQPEDHLKMQSAVQPYIDNAISKTINLPVDFPFEKVADVYTLAYSLGLKLHHFPTEPNHGSVLEADSCCPIF